jgi:hypothetical protein
MRGVLVAILAVGGLLLGSMASAQGLGDVAAREKKKRQDTPTEAKVYTEDDLGASIAPVGVPSTLPADAEAGAEATDDAEGSGSEEEEAASAEDQRAQAEAAWRRKLEQARKEEEVYQEVIERLQLELNDMSGGVYNPGRANRVEFLEENKQLLAEVQERIAGLEQEGRANNYR